MAQGAREHVTEVIVVGAGFGGLRAMHEVRKLGFSVQGLEAGTGIGGTWYWNTYPGARTDTEAWGYNYFFDQELSDGWKWSQRNPSQAEVLQYLDYVATTLNLKKDFRFNSFVESAHYDQSENQWVLTVGAGTVFRCTYLINACGPLSSPVSPQIKGLETFKGRWMHTGRWPKEGVPLAGKRVAVVGAGSTAVQVVPAVAPIAEQVTLFQRTPNYVLPGRNYPLIDIEQQSIRAEFDGIKKQVRDHAFGFPMGMAGRSFNDLDDTERRRIMESQWEIGGFQFIFETFNDLTFNRECNAAASEFIREKIRSVVKDSATAETLCPKYPFFLKRPPLGQRYYEAFNRDNVALVDLLSTPIEEITADGIKVDGEVLPFDIIIFAIGFDAGTGAFTDMDIVGRSGRSLRDDWREGPRTFFGICVDEFPNMFMVSGPQSPLTNFPPVIDAQVDWIGQVLGRARLMGDAKVEAAEEAVASWTNTVNSSADGTVLEDAADVGSWYAGANIEGKAKVMQFYFGGTNIYFKILQESADAGFPGIVFMDVQPNEALAG